MQSKGDLGEGSHFLVQKSNRVVKIMCLHCFWKVILYIKLHIVNLNLKSEVLLKKYYF